MTETAGNEPNSDPAAAPARGDLAFTDLLIGHREEVVSAWIELHKGLPDSRVLDLPRERVRATLNGILGAIAEVERSGSHARLEAALNDLCHQRLREGLDCGHVTQSLLLWTEAALPVLQRLLLLDLPALRLLFGRLNAHERWMARYWADLYVAEWGRQLEAHQSRTALLLATMRAFSSTLALDQVLSKSASAIAHAVGVPYCVVAVVEEGSATVRLKRAGRFDLSGTEVADADSFADDSIPLQALTPFSQLLYERRQPLVSIDALRDPRLHNARRLRMPCKSVLGLAFVAKDRVVALGWVATWEHYAFSQEQIDLAQGIADAAALAIENALLYDRVK